MPMLALRMLQTWLGQPMLAVDIKCKDGNASTCSNDNTASEAHAPVQQPIAGVMQIGLDVLDGVSPSVQRHLCSQKLSR